MICPYCGCDPEEEGFEQGGCTCRCHWGGNLRRKVAARMVTVHRITPALAEYHVRQMNASEVRRRFLMYVRNRVTGAECSAVGNESRAERQDAVVIESGKTVTHSVPVPNAANKPTTADRKSEAILPSTDFRRAPIPLIRLKVGGEVEGQRPSQVCKMRLCEAGKEAGFRALFLLLVLFLILPSQLSG